MHAHLDPGEAGWEQGGGAHACPEDRGPRAISGRFALAGGLEFLVCLLNIMISFFHTSPTICQGDGGASPIEIRQGLSSRGDPGFSF